MDEDGKIKILSKALYFPQFGGKPKPSKFKEFIRE